MTELTMCKIEQQRLQGRDHDRQAIAMSLGSACDPRAVAGRSAAHDRDGFCELAIGRRRFVFAERFPLTRFNRRP
jgi:hypothetical protein